MKRTPPRSRLLWIQPARRTVWPACSGRRSLQVWERYGLAMGKGKRVKGKGTKGKADFARRAEEGGAEVFARRLGGRGGHGGEGNGSPDNLLSGCLDRNFGRGT